MTTRKHAKPDPRRAAQLLDATLGSTAETVLKKKRATKLDWIVLDVVAEQTAKVLEEG